MKGLHLSPKKQCPICEGVLGSRGSWEGLVFLEHPYDFSLRLDWRVSLNEDSRGGVKHERRSCSEDLFFFNVSHPPTFPNSPPVPPAHVLCGGQMELLATLSGIIRLSPVCPLQSPGLERSPLPTPFSSPHIPPRGPQAHRPHGFADRTFLIRL